MSRRVCSLLVGGAVAAATSALVFALLLLLPRPASSVVFGARIAQAIDGISAVWSVETVGDARVMTVCRRIAGQEYLLTIGRHRRFLIDGTTLAPLEARWHRGEALAVEVAISGCPSLLTALIERQVLPGFQRQATVPIQPAIQRGVRVFRISLTKSLELVVDHRTLTPLAIRLVNTPLPGRSVLVADVSAAAKVRGG